MFWRVSPLRYGSLALALFLWTFYCQSIQAIELFSVEDREAVRDAASTAAFGMVKWYNGNMTGGVPGNLPDPYYWWMAGAFMMSLVDYWHYTGDAQYNGLVTEAILWQVGPNEDFMTPNQTKTTGNDDQAFWAFAAMDAAELRFPNPPDDQPQWLSLAQAVFNTQAARWLDEETCGGGLRWQVFPFNVGWTYKNAISNGCYFALGARLARYTGNESYADWADQVWEWTSNVGIMTPDYRFYDGADVQDNCTTMTPYEWTYNLGVYLHGAANMWNFTQAPIWRTRVDRLVASLDRFFRDDIMVEVACEPHGACNDDQRSFKAYLARWMAATAQLAPWTADNIMGKLATSAIAAAKTCNSGFDQNQCIKAWHPDYAQQWDGTFGPGEQMAALQIFGANLIRDSPAPVTEGDGGISRGDPAAGTRVDEPAMLAPIRTGDRVGAGIITAGLLSMTLGGAYWMCKQ